MIAPDQPYLYPQPLTLARGKDECERALAGDLTAYSAIYATWGRLGGLRVLELYGREHFVRMAHIRWAKARSAA